MSIGEFSTLRLATLGLVGAVGFLALSFIRRRSIYLNLPCPPHSMVWGHLRLMGEYAKKFPPGAYLHNTLTQMKLDHNLPDMFYLDLWPAGPCLLVCTSPDACAIPTTKTAFDQPELVRRFFEGNAGTGFIEATNGSLWKRLHKMLAPGLTPGAVREHTEAIINHATNLHSRLRDLAEAGETVDIRLELGRYPFDVISTVLFGEVLGLGVYEDARKAVETQGAINGSLNPLAKWRLRRELNQCFRRIEAVIEPRILVRFTQLQQQKVAVGNTNSDLLDRMLLAQAESGRGLDQSLARLILDNVNGFLVAGYGTTTDTSSYILMLLAAFPHVLEKLRDEHDRVFDRDYEKTIARLRESPGLINELRYTSAVIHETLRLFPIGVVVRAPPTNMTVFEHDGRVYPTQGHELGIAAHTMHYNPKYFPEPKKFRPERFMDDDPTFPRNAYRPFERGLRSCLGQPLAMDEMKIMLLLVARWFDFELKDQQMADKPAVSFTDMDTKLGRHAFQKFAYTATPCGSVDMKISLSG